MKALAAEFPYDEREPFLRWLAAAVVVLGAHFLIVGAVLFFYRASYPVFGGVPVVLFELSATPSSPATPPTNIAHGPNAKESAAKPHETEKMREAPARTSDAVPLKTEKPQQQDTPSPQTTAPPNYDAPESRARSAPAVGSSRAAPDPNETAWRNLLVAHLQKFKRYPRSAMARHVQGIVLLGFTVDREGRLVSRNIVRGSGSDELDQEALDMIQRAQPLPPFPATMQQEAQSFTVPVRFYLP